MSNDYAKYDPRLTMPSDGAFEITPADDELLPYVTQGLYVGGAGNVKASMAGGATVTFIGLLAGIVYPFRLRQVFATDTTATDLVGLVAGGEYAIFPYGTLDFSLENNSQYLPLF